MEEVIQDFEQKCDIKPNKSLLFKFIKFSNFDVNNPNEYKIVHKNQFKDEYADLYFQNGGSWCRKESVSKSGFKIATIQKNGKINYLWEQTEEEEKIIELEFAKNKIKDGNKSGIVSIGIFGVSDDKKKGTRNIHNKIKTYFKNKSCCVCGSNSNLEIDHKNDLYNDPRVLNIKTQEQNDFQSLCKHCNDQKRQVNKKMRETGKRYSAMKILSLKIYNIDFIEGDETYDPNDINAMVGTYWYDPVAFHKSIYKILKG